MKQSSRSFSKDVSNMLTKYSILPIALAFVSAVVVLCSVYYFSVNYSAQQHRDLAARRMEESVETYRAYTQNLKQAPQLAELLQTRESSLSAAEMLYDFVNSQQLRGEFFLLDAEGACVLGSSTYLSSYLQMSPPFYSGILHRMDSKPDEVVLMLNNAGVGRRDSMVLSVGTAITHAGQTLGFLIFELDPEETLDYISGPGSGELVVTDSYHTVLLTSKNSYVSSYSKLDAHLEGAQGLVSHQGTKLYVTHCPLGDLGLELYNIVEISSFYQALGVTAILSIVLLLAMLMVNFLLVRKMAAVEAGSIDRLIADLRKMQENGIYTPIEPQESRGFASLEQTYVQLLDDIRALVEANQQEAVMRTTAEIKQLESQFNPHFIFNTLEVIRCLIKLDPAGANRMILDFSDLLRYSIDSSRQTVSLQDDLTYIRSYLSIVQIRRSIQLDYQIHMEDGTQNCQVPKLSLQPIVENAVKYAARDRENLSIRVDIQRENETLLLKITDDGAGIPSQRLENIRRTLAHPQLPDQFFGLYNVHRRIRLMYGPLYGLEIDSALGEGTVVTVRLPFTQEGST